MALKPWQQKERGLVAGFGGRVTPGSGNQWFAKGDGDSRFFKFEVKTTEKESFSLKKSVLLKIQQEALLAHKHPAIIVDVQGAQWAAVPYKLFQSLVEAWISLQDSS